MKNALIEYEVRPLNGDGDALDVYHFATAKEAVEFAKELAGSVAAVVVERHVSRRPAHRFAEPDSYRVIRAFGSAEALQRWGN